MSIEKCLKIGEVSRQLNIPSYVLRYWEDEFRELKPRKTRSGQRLYSQKDLELIQTIAHLRYEEKLTVSGCKARLKSLKDGVDQSEPSGRPDKSIQATLLTIKKGLQDVLEDLR